MLKKIKLKNSTLLLIGIIIIFVGFGFGFYEFYESKKNEIYSEMNISLYNNETPEIIISNENIETKEVITNNDGKKENNGTINYIGLIEISKINLKRGFLGLDSKYNDVNYNVTIINGSTFPNYSNSNLILAAHSGICTVCYFNNLYKLSKEDIAYIYYKNIKYEYKLVNTYDTEKDGNVPIYRNSNKKVLTLITCTKNSNTKQTVYIFELVKEKEY